VIGVVLLAALVATALGAAPPRQDDGDRLAAGLGSASWAEREAAARKLVALGKQAIPALERALDSRDAEVRHRAAQLIRRLRWELPPGLSRPVAAAMEHYASLPEPQRLELLSKVVRELGSEAAVVLRQVLRVDPSAAARKQALDRLARIDLAAAEVELRALAAEKGSAVWALEQLGNLLYRRGQAEGAIAAFEQARAAGSKDPALRLSLARLHKRSRQWAKARQLYLELLEGEKESLDILRELGQCHYMLGERAEAEAAWRRMVRAQRHSPQAYLWLARAYSGIGAADKELSALREGCDRHPGDYELLRQCGRALLRERLFAEAVSIYERALGTDGAEYQRRAITIELARVLRASGQLAAYVRRKEEGLAALDREIAGLLLELAGRRLAEGDGAGARAALERLIALYPDTPHARDAARRLHDLRRGANP